MKSPKFAAAVAVALLAAGAPATAQTVRVVLNGQTMSFDQPPIMRNNRVFVPMRAIFEAMGATVVYSNGVINAQGRGRSVHLTIGSPQATINGNATTLDVAPFTVAGRTEVPLRFVAESLGANVQWNPSSETVTINGHGGAPENYSGGGSDVTFSNLRPARGATVNTTHPYIRATFAEPVQRGSLRVSVDGRDVTNDVFANANGFNVTPNFELVPGSHRVSVSGTTQSGAAFNTGWSFVTTAGAAGNYIRNLSPGAGARVGGNFRLSGRTAPGSTVHVVAQGSAGALGGLLQIGTGTFETDTTANGNGYFSVPVSVNAVGGGSMVVIVTSTSPDGSSIEQRIVYTM